MKSVSKFAIMAVVVLFAITAVSAQKLTERYIPIGKSPGLSGKHTIIGTVTAVDRPGKTLTCIYSGGSVTVKVDKNTKFWMDRSKQKLTNLDCSLGDCAMGRTIEIKFRNNERGPEAVAEWIKVEAPQPENQ